MTACTLGTTSFWAIESRLYLFIPVVARVTWSAVLAPITVLHAYFITVRSVIKSILELFLQIGGSGTETMSDSEREWGTCGSHQKPEKSSLQKTGNKGATRGTKTETTGPHEATKPCPVQRSGQGHGWSLETGKTNYKYWRSNRTMHLSETTETVFTRSKFSFKVWLSQFEEYSELADIPERLWLLCWTSWPTEPFNDFEFQKASHIKGS